MSLKDDLSIDYSVRPKPVIWFRSDTETETQIGRYFCLIPVTNIETIFQKENLVTNSMGPFLLLLILGLEFLELEFRVSILI